MRTQNRTYSASPALQMWQESQKILYTTIWIAHLHKETLGYQDENWDLTIVEFPAEVLFLKINLNHWFFSVQIYIQVFTITVFLMIYCLHVWTPWSVKRITERLLNRVLIFIIINSTFSIQTSLFDII